ncbi:MAG: HWE histidine kinase domain-containing protein [Alphaproteobacteria bacterium]
MDAVNTDVGSGLMSEYRQQVEALEAEEQVILRSRLVHADRIEARTLPVLAILVVGVAGLVLLGVWLERRAAFAVAAAHEVEQVRAARGRAELLAHELTHRVNNLFSIVLSILSLTTRAEPDAKVALDKSTERIRALSRAHAVVQGRSTEKMASLNDVVRATVEPYLADDLERVSVSGTDVELPASYVTSLGLIVHELATNAVKYGALSLPEGRVQITWKAVPDSPSREISLHWQEVGGPDVVQPEGRGFGTTMIEAAVSQLGGTVDQDWHRRGVDVWLIFPLGD